jgi:hypothetical protein
LVVLLRCQRAPVTARSRLWRAAETGIRHIRSVRNKPYGVDAAFMSLDVHGRGIHIV